MNISSMIKPFSLFSLVCLLIGCGGSKLPEPTPLSSFPASATLKKAWSMHPNAGNHELLFTLTPISDKDVLYVAGNDGKVSAIDILQGKILWSRQYKDLNFSSHLALKDDALYLGTDNAEIVKLNKADGTLLWKKSLSSTIIAAPKANDHLVFTKTINGEITALDTKTGTAVWNDQQSLPSLTLRETSDPLLYQHLVIAGFSNGNLSAYDQASGNTLWNKQISLPEGKTDVERMADLAANPTIADDIIYAATYQGKLMAFNAQTQDTLWTADISIYNSFSLSENAIFIDDIEGNVMAIDRATGSIRWKQTALRYRSLTAPTYLGDNLVAVADKEGYLHILNAATGEFVARTSVDSDGIIAPPLRIKDLILVQTNEGRVYAYKILLMKP